MIYFQVDQRILDSFFCDTIDLAFLYAHLPSVVAAKYNIESIATNLAIDDSGNSSEALDFFTFCNQSQTTVSNDTTQGRFEFLTMSAKLISCTCGTTLQH